MNVLSLFDGMSCGQLALQRANIPYNNYFSSEIDRHAIKVISHHFPNTVHLGSVAEIEADKLPIIDLLIGGSPCKGFSNAGSGLNFEHPESKLFFEWVRLWKEKKPKWFLLENVKMKKEWENIITKILGVRPIRLDSGLVTAQVRKRLYWTNIPVIDIPKNKHLSLADIIEDGVALREKAYTIDANYYKGGKKTQKPLNQSQRRNMVIQINPSLESGGTQPYQQNRVYDINGKVPALLASMSSGTHSITTHSLQPRTGKGNGGKGPLKKQDGKSYCLDTGNGQVIEYNGEKRKLTVNECCRLQTVPDNYFKGIVSDTQAYKMLGNGWTVDIIAHILSFIPS